MEIYLEYNIEKPVDAILAGFADLSTNLVMRACHLNQRKAFETHGISVSCVEMLYRLRSFVSVFTVATGTSSCYPSHFTTRGQGIRAGPARQHLVARNLSSSGPTAGLYRKP